MLRSILTACSVLALLWFGYWFWGAKPNKLAVEDFLADQENWTISYSSSTQRGFPNRYDITLKDVRIAARDETLEISIPIVQIMRLTYRPNHWIIGMSGDILAKGQVGKWNVTADKLLASVITAPNGVNATLEANNLRISNEHIQETPHLVLSAIIIDESVNLGARMTNEQGSELFIQSTAKVEGMLPSLPLNLATTPVFKFLETDGSKAIKGELSTLSFPIELQKTVTNECERKTQFWVFCS